MSNLEEWLTSVSGHRWSWFVKRLSANDTGQTGGHGSGFYVPNDFAHHVAPELKVDLVNPRRSLEFQLASHDQSADARLIYYNSRPRTGQTNGRNEFRVTGFGGRKSALQDPKSTGGILVTAWQSGSKSVQAWLTQTLSDEEVVEGVTGPIDPGTHVVRTSGSSGQLVLFQDRGSDCSPDLSELPKSWIAEFPAGSQLCDEAVRRVPGRGESADSRLVKRYRCEFGLFKVVEAAYVQPEISTGFNSVDEFVQFALRVTNRRKSRSGRSLELHLENVFREEGVRFDANKVTEVNRRPDFVFPSISDYHAGKPTRMLGVKTSVKDRWRQVLDEAAKIPEKHLFTLSEGVSVDQFAQMNSAGLTLVVPEGNMKTFPKSIRSELMTLSDFCSSVKS